MSIKDSRKVSSEDLYRDLPKPDFDIIDEYERERAANSHWLDCSEQLNAPIISNVPPRPQTPYHQRVHSIFSERNLNEIKYAPKFNLTDLEE